MSRSLPPTNEDPTSQQSQPVRDNRILGLSTDQLAGLSVDEVTGNKTAVTMVIHYYKQLVDENTSLRNEVNTMKTYVDGYATKKTNTTMGAILLAVSNICIGFGVNLLTSGSTWPGLATLIPGIALVITGLFFSLKDNR
jgi:hypothetical protein